ncbi:lysophospholipid acyltransferase family protein [uncultured Roseovarius sp.]|uniref:lysophospholipid acyltransferase family protein n=1 Tax=uncultured Roseovarius sp. TaxID=293344 RepID=UPI000C5BF5B2|nr:1-acyl-sn-glycerol-3-phosphate acyltransferase [Roseovarius sp.]MBD11908.1 1-acyl-sn-glycerol-3-phosphate acyltransferase [Roseovarius sp.]|tara:strand:- start:786 stop:1532 length:747 start_codon:yes stop_codon:yes gene_type:complete
MKYAVQWVRSLLFVAQMYVMLPVVGLIYMPAAIVSRKGALAGCKAYCRWVRWTAAWMVGLRTEVRGTPPDGQVLIASKHQSFLDILLIFSELPAGRFIMKREILWTPVIGLYGMRIGCVPVDRGKRGAAIKKMVEDVARGAQTPGQLIIYAQGTRVAPGAKMPYKIGTAVLYEQMGVPCVPAATNVGVFWPKRGIYRKPGLAVVEFLPAIEQGLDRDSFMTRLEHDVESASNALMREAGFDPEQPARN